MNMAKKKIIVAYPSLAEIESVAHELARRILTLDEPIPDFSTRFPEVLERCLATPRQTFGRRDLYANLLDKAAILFYTLIKDHPFQNGNKRVAIMTLFYFLHINGKWVVVDTMILYRFARWVAESDPTVKDAVIDAITKFLSDNLTGR